MGELNIIRHVQMKIDAISDVINQLKSQYDWMKSKEDEVYLPLLLRKEIGRASCRERVCQYV